jgi:hypothetical protein
MSEENINPDETKIFTISDWDFAELVRVLGNALYVRMPSTFPENAKMLRDWWHHLIRNHGYFKSFGVFLVLPADTEASNYILKNGRELHLLSGANCGLFVLRQSEFRGTGFYSERWEQGVTFQVKEGLSLEFGRHFEIEATDFPCFLLFGDIRKSEHVRINLKEMDENQISHLMREVFSVISRANNDKEDIVKMVQKHISGKERKSKGKIVVKTIRSFGTKSLETAMSAWIKALLSQP